MIIFEYSRSQDGVLQVVGFEFQDGRGLGLDKKNGLLPIYKPKGMVSKDISRVLQKQFGKLKLGHVGTLDPMAEGVLPIVLGKATRLQDYLLDSEKIYEVEAKFGYSTDSQDVEGKTVGTASLPSFNELQLSEVLSSMTGVITQTPPIYSAVKYKGRALYDYARAGLEAEVPLAELSRKINIFSADLLSVERNLAGELSGCRLRLACSKGTYVRTFVDDFARKIGTLGVMSGLKRLKTAGVDSDQCVDLSELLVSPELAIKHLVSLDAMPHKLPVVALGRDNSKHMIHGRPVDITIDQLRQNVVKNLEFIDLTGHSWVGVEVLVLNDEGSSIAIAELVSEKKVADQMTIDTSCEGLELVGIKKKRGL